MEEVYIVAIRRKRNKLRWWNMGDAMKIYMNYDLFVLESDGRRWLNMFTFDDEVLGLRLIFLSFFYWDMDLWFVSLIKYNWI